jgi:hypothetical protein
VCLLTNANLSVCPCLSKTVQVQSVAVNLYGAEHEGHVCESCTAGCPSMLS